MSGTLKDKGGDSGLGKIKIQKNLHPKPKSQSQVIRRPLIQNTSLNRFCQEALRSQVIPPPFLQKR